MTKALATERVQLMADVMTTGTGYSEYVMTAGTMVVTVVMFEGVEL